MMKRKAIVTQKLQISKNSFRIRLQESYLTGGMFSEHMQKLQSSVILQAEKRTEKFVILAALCSK
jgi:hypothetical protein